ncbi:MAG: RNA polymerase sigma factor [Xanthomonadaceae bacterium]|nr:RNA polymerase sigma factor [Xanthomonadaceae bacterium]
MTDEEHQALLQQVMARNAGSENAMAQLYRALSGQVFAFVRQRLSAADDHTVQSVVQEVLYEVWRAAPHFSGASMVKTWVLGIARHKLLDAARRNRHAGRHDDIADHAETLPDESADILATLAEKQRAEWLAFCMDKLPVDQRESLHLLLVEALSVQAIADIQGCPGGTVKTRVFHAKAKLKNCLARWLRHDGDTPGAPDIRGNAA